MLSWLEYGKFLVALWALVQPVGAVPLFLHLTEQCPDARRRIGGVAAIAAGVILILCVFVGQAFLLAFGIDIPSFRVAGGLLLLYTAFAMISRPGQQTPETTADAREATVTDAVAIVPLAMPTLAGPGAISTVIVYAHQSASLSHYVLLCAVIVAVAVSTCVVFRLARVIGALLGRTGMQVFTQIMGLLLAAIAVEFMTQGLAAIFPGWR